MFSPNDMKIPVSRCLFCGIENKQLSSCSKCQWAVYCSRECQQSDWKSHKRNCEPPIKAFKKIQDKYPQFKYDRRLNIRKSHGKGQGLFATEDIPAHQILIIDFPISIGLKERGKLLFILDPKEIQSLHLHYKPDIHRHLLTSIHNSNSFEFEDKGSHCFSLLSKVNHDIKPNSYYVKFPKGKICYYILITNRDIKKNEEITIDYLYLRDELYYDRVGDTQKVKEHPQLRSAIQNLYQFHQLGEFSSQVTDIYRNKLLDLQNFLDFLFKHISPVIKDVPLGAYETSPYDNSGILPKVIDSFGFYRIIETLVEFCQNTEYNLPRLISELFEDQNPELFSGLMKMMLIRREITRFTEGTPLQGNALSSLRELDLAETEVADLKELSKQLLSLKLSG